VTTWRLLFLLSLASVTAGASSEQPTLSCKVSVPPQARGAEKTEKSPNGESNAVRYTTAYEAYWWNCVFVRADALDARCPFICSGNPAATLGCADGGAKATNDIDELVRRVSGKRTREYLRTLAHDPVGRLKIKPYFGSGPRAEAPTR